MDHPDNGLATSALAEVVWGIAGHGRRHTEPCATTRALWLTLPSPIAQGGTIKVDVKTGNRCDPGAS